MALPGYTDPITKKALEGLQTYEVKATKPNNTYNLSGLGNTGNIDPTRNQNIINPPTSDIQTQIAGLMSQMTQMQSQVDEAKKVGYSETEQIQTDANGKVVPKVAEAPKEESVWDKLMGKQKETEAQMQAMPSADELVKNTLSRWGLTPESYQGMNNIAAQIGEVNKQIATLEQQEMEAVNAVQTRPGQTIDWTTGEANRISREYAIKKSGLSGMAAALGTQLSALQGNWKTAQSMAETAINASLTAQKQKVDDLQWADEFYSDIIQAMDKSDQDTWKTMLQYEQDTYKAQEAQAKGVRDIVLGNPNAFMGMDWTKLTPDQAAMMSANNPKASTTQPTTYDKKQFEVLNIDEQLFNSRGKDGFVDPSLYYALKRQTTLTPSEFDSRFGQMLSPQERKNLGVEKEIVTSQWERDSAVWQKLGENEDSWSDAEKKSFIMGMGANPQDFGIY